MKEIRRAIAEYAAIVEGIRSEYTREELTIKAIRQDHPELDFMDDDEIEEIIGYANRGRSNEKKVVKEMDRYEVCRVIRETAVEMTPAELRAWGKNAISHGIVDHDTTLLEKEGKFYEETCPCESCVMRMGYSGLGDPELYSLTLATVVEVEVIDRYMED